MVTRTYWINHTCGHREKHELEGRAIEVKREAALLETVPCTTCQETPPHADPITEARAVSAAVAYNTERVPSSDVVHCALCGRAMKPEHAMRTALGVRHCPDCLDAAYEADPY